MFGSGFVDASQLDLNLLRALDALLQERHVTRAALKCGLSEPAMSRSLRRLRQLFADEILVRVGRQYYLTSFALDLVGPVHDIVQLIGSTLEIGRASCRERVDVSVISIP